jgi:AraC-like DNA-binding protein
VERIEFGVGWNGFAVASAYAEQKIVSSDPARLLNVYDGARPRITVDGRSTTAHVRGLFHDALRNKVAVPDLEHAAKKMGISGRTLQRRLAEEGTSFQGMRESARQDLARVYIDEPRLTVGEVAFLLGYPEVTHFTRAFRRWTGMTPKEFRRTRGKVA